MATGILKTCPMRKLGEISNGEMTPGLSGQNQSVCPGLRRNRDERINRIAVQLGYEVIMWSLDTIDWQNPDMGTIVKRVGAPHP